MLSKSSCCAYAPDRRLSGCRALHSRRLLPTAPRLRPAAPRCSRSTNGNADDGKEPRTASSSDSRNTSQQDAVNAPLPLLRLLKAVRALEIDALIGEAPQHTPLLMACIKNNTERIRGLLSLGASPDIASKDLPRPIVIASYQGNTEAVQDLLRAGANPNFLSSDMNSPLEVACSEGQAEVVKALLQAGASPTAVGTKGMTPIGIACSADDVPGPVCAEIVKLLLQAGADPRVTEESPPEESSSVEAADVGASRVTMGGTSGTSRRGRASRGRGAGKGASQGKSSGTGLPALDTLNALKGTRRRAGGPRAIELAAHYGIAEVIPVLVAAGEDPGRAPADVSLEDLMAGAPVPPLCIAAGQGHVGAVQALVAAGADVEAIAGVLGEPDVDEQESEGGLEGEGELEGGLGVDGKLEDGLGVEGESEDGLGIEGVSEDGLGGEQESEGGLEDEGESYDWLQRALDSDWLQRALDSGWLQRELEARLEGGLLGSAGGGLGGGTWRLGTGMTALCFAVHKGHVDVVRALLAAGADPCKHRALLLGMAQMDGNKEMEEVLRAAQAAWKREERE